MKALSAVFVGAFCAGLSMTAAAHLHVAKAEHAQMPVMQKDSKDVRTSDVEYATPERLDPQVVQSQGGSSRPGPHNRHFSTAHGGSVTAGDRSDVRDAIDVPALNCIACG